MMIYSYAACFAAVTLRIWLPLLIMIFGDFIIAYTIVAWMCWIPNLIVARLITRKLTTQKLQTAPVIG
jgi:dolichyl-phosphate-mannose--protein O-mannosyl transferase